MPRGITAPLVPAAEEDLREPEKFLVDTRGGGTGSVSVKLKKGARY